MGWSSVFRDRISRSNFEGAVFYLAQVNAPFLPNSGATLSSASAPGLFPTSLGLMTGVQVPSESVEPYTWNTTHGSWSVDVVIDSPSVLGLFPRGALCQLFVGFPNISTSDYAAVALGIIEQIQCLGPNEYRLSLGGLGMVFGSRLDKTASQGSLFFNLPASSTLTADYDNAVDGTLTVGSIAGAERETGGDYLVQVVTSETDGSGNTYAPYYLLASSASGTTVTLTGGAPASGVLGTTARNANTGDTVNYLAYVAGDHPVDIARKVLTSTGSGNNGVYDTLPQSWGIGLPSSLIDSIGANATRNVVDPTVWATAAVLIQDTAAEDPGTWLSEWLAPMGIWYTVRQGEVTFRAAENPLNAKQQTGIDVGQFITQGGLQSHLWFDPSYPGEYTNVLYVDDGATQSRGAQETPAATLPALDQITYSIPAYSNILNCLIEVDGRMSSWALRIPGIITIDTAGWYCSQTCAGDGALVTSNRFQDLEGAFNQREVLILGTSPAIVNGSFTTRLDLAVLPKAAN